MTNTEIDAARIPYTSRRWRVVDLVTATAIAAASGLVFWMWDFICTAPLTLFGAVTPGFEGILNAFWLFAGPLAAIIIRKPGAALYAETVAAMLELLLGNQWGAGGSLVVGIMQGSAPSSASHCSPTGCGIWRARCFQEHWRDSAAASTTGSRIPAGACCAQASIWPRRWSPARSSQAV